MIPIAKFVERFGADKMAPNLRFLFNFICLTSHLNIGFSLYHTGDKCLDSFGNEGVCQPYYRCLAPYDPSNGGILPRLCSFRWFGPIVCCPQPTKITTTTPPSEDPIQKPGDKAKHWCNEYTKVCPKKVSITGGEIAKEGEFAHMAAIGFGPLDNPKWHCGGALISENFVLTAAHCLYGFNTGPVQWVRLGAVDLLNSVNGQTHPVIRRIRHPDYSSESKYNDVALLEIGPAVENYAFPTTSRQLHPICLPTLGDEKQIENAIATGWGTTSFGGDPSPVLLKVELDVLNTSKCNETFDLEIRYGSSLKMGIDSKMICAGNLCGGKDTCQGDSGGPLQIPIRHTCMYEILGITAFGSFCGCKNAPGVYMRVSEYVPWIESIVWS